MMRQSRFSMGMDSSRSRPLPCGTPSMMSIRTTSANSFEAIQCAAVAPTFPEPTIVTFLRMVSFLHRAQSRSAHVFDDVIRELARRDFGCALHQPLEIVCNFLLQDGALHPMLDQVGRLAPS